MSGPTFCFVVTTCWKDFHYARVLLESLYHFHPDIPVKVIVDGEEAVDFLHKAPNVISIDRTADLEKHHGLGLYGLLSDLNLFFFDDSDYYIRVDADSVFIGDVIEGIQSQMPFDFLSLDGTVIDLREDQNLKLFSHYAFSPSKMIEIGESFPLGPVVFFSGGHFCVRKGLLNRNTIAKWRPHLSHEFGKSSLFRFNDQSLLNFLINSLDHKGEIKARVWPVTVNGRSQAANYPHISLENMLEKRLFDHKIIHFTGPSRTWKLKNHNFGWALTHFESLWYKRVGHWGKMRDRITSHWHHYTERKTWSGYYHTLRSRVSSQ